MCTRYASDLTMDDWATLYDLAMEGPPPWNFEPSYNVTLTQTIPVVVWRDGRRVLERMRWGIIPHKHKGTIKDHKLSTYNTRSEKVETSWTFAKIWQRNRCLIPVSGFYEWYHTPGAKKGTRRSRITSPTRMAPLPCRSPASSIAGTIRRTKAANCSRAR
jgi:putative SOS response-associated peptidase YedK